MRWANAMAMVVSWEFGYAKMWTKLDGTAGNPEGTQGRRLLFVGLAFLVMTKIPPPLIVGLALFLMMTKMKMRN